jgi:hypothetical protein
VKATTYLSILRMSRAITRTSDLSIFLPKFVKMTFVMQNQILEGTKLESRATPSPTPSFSARHLETPTDCKPIYFVQSFGIHDAAYQSLEANINTALLKAN